MAPGRPPLCSPSEGQTLGLGARSQGLSTGAHPGGGLGAAGGLPPRRGAPPGSGGNSWKWARPPCPGGRVSHSPESGPALTFEDARACGAEHHSSVQGRY